MTSTTDMPESNWEKNSELASQLSPKSGQRRIFMFAGIGLIVLVLFLVVRSTLFGASYYMTVDELREDETMINKSVRVSAAVDGDMVQGDKAYIYNEDHTLTFWIVNIPNDSDEIREAGGIAKVLHDATENEDLERMQVIYEGEPPELLQHEAQAILEGYLGDDGIFYADSLQLKCPTKYEDDDPDRVSGSSS